MPKEKKIEKNSLENKIKEVLEKIRPSLQMDGGDAEFVSWDKKSGQVKIRLVGHCAHCPMAQVTLKHGIEAEIKKQIKQVKEVLAV